MGHKTVKSYLDFFRKPKVLLNSTKRNLLGYIFLTIPMNGSACFSFTARSSFFGVREFFCFTLLKHTTIFSLVCQTGDASQIRANLSFAESNGILKLTSVINGFELNRIHQGLIRLFMVN